MERGKRRGRRRKRRWLDGMNAFFSEGISRSIYGWAWEDGMEKKGRRGLEGKGSLR